MMNNNNPQSPEIGILDPRIIQLWHQIENEPEQTVQSFEKHYHSNKNAWRYSFIHIIEEAEPSTKSYLEFFSKVLASSKIKPSDLFEPEDIKQITKESYDLWVNKSYQTELEFRLNLALKLRDLLEDSNRKNALIQVISEKLAISPHQIPAIEHRDLSESRIKREPDPKFSSEPLPLNARQEDHLAFLESMNNEHSSLAFLKKDLFYSVSQYIEAKPELLVTSTPKPKTMVLR